VNGARSAPAIDPTHEVIPMHMTCGRCGRFQSLSAWCHAEPDPVEPHRVWNAPCRACGFAGKSRVPPATWACLTADAAAPALAWTALRRVGGAGLDRLGRRVLRWGSLPAGYGLPLGGERP